MIPKRKIETYCVLLICLLFINQWVYGQNERITLSPLLKESSALVKYKDLYITINDSGNEPMVYFLNSEGEIIHNCFLINAHNKDWEALALGVDSFLFIGDIGNNLNLRKDLVIYKVAIHELLQKDSTTAEIIRFQYEDQEAFPPAKDRMYWDAEAMIIRDNQIIIFTKNRTRPFDGIVKVYELPTVSGHHTAKLIQEISLGKTDWKIDSVTDASYDGELLYLLTYMYIYVLKEESNTWKIKDILEHENWTQKEGITTDSEYIYMTDENAFNLFKGNYLYQRKK